MNIDELREKYHLLFELHAAARGGDTAAIDDLFILGDDLLQRIERDQEAAHQTRVQSGKVSSKKQENTFFHLAANAYSEARKLDSAFRAKGYDAWENAAKQVHAIAGENGIKDPRTVDRYLEKWRPFFKGLKKESARVFPLSDKGNALADCFYEI